MQYDLGTRSTVLASIKTHTAIGFFSCPFLLPPRQILASFAEGFEAMGAWRGPLKYLLLLAVAILLTDTIASPALIPVCQ